MPLVYSTLGCPGDSLDQVIATAHAAGATGLELRAAAGEFVFPGMDDARSAAVTGHLAEAGLTVLALARYVQVCAAAPDPVHGGGAMIRCLPSCWQASNLPQNCLPEMVGRARSCGCSRAPDWSLANQVRSRPRTWLPRICAVHAG